MTHPRSLYRAGRGEGSHITAQAPPKRRSREEIDADMAAKRDGVQERAAKAREQLDPPLEARRPGNAWGFQ